MRIASADSPILPLPMNLPYLIGIEATTTCHQNGCSPPWRGRRLHQQERMPPGTTSRLTALPYTSFAPTPIPLTSLP